MLFLYRFGAARFPLLFVPGAYGYPYIYIIFYLKGVIEMGYCMEMKSAKFFVPTEYTGRVFAKAEDSSYYFTLDPEGNITDIEFQ